MSRGAKIGIWILILAVVVVLFVITGARRLQKEEVQSIESVQEAEGIPVDVVRSRVMRIENWREFVGVAEGYEQVDLIAPFRTRVAKVHASVGDEVRAGKVIVSLDPYDPARMGMNLQAAQSQYDAAQQDSLRIEALYRSGAVSEQDVDHVRASTETARAFYLTARRAVELDTPISGVVTAVNVEDGDFAASEQTLATVAFYDRIRIPLSVSESERAMIRVGQEVRLALGGRRAGTAGCPPGGETSDTSRLAESSVASLRGKVVKAALSADQASRLFAVEVVVDNPDHVLRPGMLVTPEILVASTEDQPVVPPAALLSHDGHRRLYIVDDSGEFPVARLRDVTEGVGNGNLVAVARGLSSGDLVVVWGQNNISDGVKVKIHADLSAERYESGQ